LGLSREAEIASGISALSSEQQQARILANPKSKTFGTGGGFLVPGALEEAGGMLGLEGLGALTPLGLTGEAGEAVGAAGGATGMIGRGVVEGGLLGAGNAIDEHALGSPDELQDSLLSQAGLSALTGGAFGAGLFGIKSLISPAAKIAEEAHGKMGNIFSRAYAGVASKASGAAEDAILGSIDDVGAATKPGALDAEKAAWEAKVQTAQDAVDKAKTDAADALENEQNAHVQAVKTATENLDRAKEVTAAAGDVEQMEHAQALKQAQEALEKAEADQEAALQQAKLEHYGKVQTAQSALENAQNLAKAASAKAAIDAVANVSRTSVQARDLLQMVHDTTQDMGKTGFYGARDEVIDRLAPFWDPTKAIQPLGGIVRDGATLIPKLSGAQGRALYDQGAVKKLSTYLDSLTSMIHGAVDPETRTALEAAEEAADQKVLATRGAMRAFQNDPNTTTKAAWVAAKADAAASAQAYYDALSQAGTKLTNPDEAAPKLYRGIYSLKQAAQDVINKADSLSGAKAKAQEAISQSFLKPLTDYTERKDIWGQLGEQTAKDNAVVARNIAARDAIARKGLGKLGTNGVFNPATVGTWLTDTAVGASKAQLKTEAYNEFMDSSKEMFNHERNLRALTAEPLTNPERHALINRAWETLKSGVVKDMTPEELETLDKTWKEIQPSLEKGAKYTDGMRIADAAITAQKDAVEAHMHELNQVLPTPEALTAAQQRLEQLAQEKQLRGINGAPDSPELVMARQHVENLKAAGASGPVTAGYTPDVDAAQAHLENLKASGPSGPATAGQMPGVPQAQSALDALKAAGPQGPASQLEKLKAFGNKGLGAWSTGGLGYMAYQLGIPHAVLFPLLAARIIGRMIDNPYSTIKAYGTIARIHEAMAAKIESGVGAIFKGVHIPILGAAGAALVHKTAFQTPAHPDESRSVAYQRHANDLSTSVAQGSPASPSISALAEHAPNLALALGSGASGLTHDLAARLPGVALPSSGKPPSGPNDVAFAKYARALEVAEKGTAHVLALASQKKLTIDEARLWKKHFPGHANMVAQAIQSQRAKQKEAPAFATEQTLSLLTHPEMDIQRGQLTARLQQNFQNEHMKAVASKANDKGLPKFAAMSTTKWANTAEPGESQGA
jgi:hypothetical protein